MAIGEEQLTGDVLDLRDFLLDKKCIKKYEEIVNPCTLSFKFYFILLSKGRKITVFFFPSSSIMMFSHIKNIEELLLSKLTTCKIFISNMISQSKSVDEV